MEETTALIAKLRDKVHQQPSTPWRLSPMASRVIEQGFILQQVHGFDDSHAAALIACCLAETCNRLEDQVYKMTVTQPMPPFILLKP